MERVVITGIGLVTPCGNSKAQTWSNIVEGRSGIATITGFEHADQTVHIAGEVKNLPIRDALQRSKIKEMGRFAQLSVIASRACIEDAGIALSDEERDKCGTFIGVGLGGLEWLYHYSTVLKDKGPRKVGPYFIPQVIANLAAGQVAIDLDLRGPSYATTSACASSTHALGDAADWIRLGRTPLMVAGGAEATVTALGIAGFAAMFALSRRNDAPEKASRPWDRGRDGFVCSEGAATLLLESLSHAKARGAKIYAELTGYGASCDAHHITAPGGDGAARAMRMALADAKLDKSDIDYVNAHATSTPVGDVQEAKSIMQVFGSHASDHAPDKKLWVSSTKSHMGHLLGAAGAVEAAICALAIAEGRVPATINLDDPDPEVGLDLVPHETRERALSHVMSNSFGFGGTNATVVLSRYHS